jgi:L-seryl-tRNA(Ser) seleniumtransferase
MKSAEATDVSNVFQLLPSVDELLRTDAAKKIAGESGAKHLTMLARGVVAEGREQIVSKERVAVSRSALLSEMEKALENAWAAEHRTAQRRVINATGVIIHTNLGRAPLSDAARKAIVEASGYCSLEYDLETGKRGKRGGRAERLLAELTGAESALIVNNCAAAAYLVLSVLARGGEAVISRGELVEIGGDFRVPDVLAQSGTALKEVGTTNRTKLADYEKAIGENTRLLLKVHPSNYRITGFTAVPGIAELAALAHSRGLFLYEDAGSGALLDLSRYGLGDEPLISGSIAAGADVVTFSGDKLLGASQAGLIVGKREIIGRLRKHPLYRVLRADKLAYASLEATLEAYRRETALDEIPVLKMLAMTKDEIRERARIFASKLETSGWKIEIIDGHSVIGGGAAPAVQPETVLIALEAPGLSADGLEEKLRSSDPPVITRIENDRVVIDLRTISDSEEEELIDALAAVRNR